MPRCAGPAEPRASDFQFIALRVLAADGAVCTLSRGWREAGVGLGGMKAAWESGYSGTSGKTPLTLRRPWDTATFPTDPDSTTKLPKCLKVPQSISKCLKVSQVTYSLLICEKVNTFSLLRVVS